MKFNFLEARKHAREQEKKAGDKIKTLSAHEFKDIDPTIYKYFFDHQAKLEKDGEAKKTGMDYRAYARRMWEQLVGEINEQNSKYVEQFENALVSGLHGIDMHPLVYSHLATSLAELVNKYQTSIKHLALWSTGDVAATGYQVGKIDSSKVIGLYHQALKEKFPNVTERERVLREQTSYMVADNKFEDLVNYVAKILQTQPDQEIKIVIVEDSRKNFEKVIKVIAENLGEKANSVRIIPIWATYSREGQQAKKAATGDGVGAFETQKKDLNAIDSFEDLLDDRFRSVLDGAHVFVDFDGVIGDNVAMRDEQARVTYNALIHPAMESLDASERDLAQAIKTKIEAIK